MGSKQHLNTASFIAKAVNTHGDTYDYCQVQYVNSKTKVSIICKTHGVFHQSAAQHLKGMGCRLCAIDNRKMNAIRDVEDVLSHARSVHGERYDYSKIDYKGLSHDVEIICSKHGQFTQRIGDHLYKKAGCPRCGVRFSAAEDEICQMLDSLGLEYVKADRTILKPLELDILIPSHSLAIEYNGLKWHSEEFGKDRWYHLDKTEKCKLKGYRLIHLWENDWNSNKELQMQFLKHQLGFSGSKVYARKCQLNMSVDKCVINDFLDRFHLQGRCVFTYSVCLFHNDELTSVSCFTKRGDQFELVRHCNSVRVIGSLGKTVKHFLRIMKKEIYTFLDMSRFSGDSYAKAGFELIGVQKPDYSYVKHSKRYHKFLFRKERIKTKLPEFYDPNLTERQMMQNAGYQRLWDCGKLKYLTKP